MSTSCVKSWTSYQNPSFPMIDSSQVTFDVDGVDSFTIVVGKDLFYVVGVPLLSFRPYC